MSKASTIELGELMASKSGSVDPANYPDEIFDLYSIPAFDSGHPEIVPGRAIGSAKQVVKVGDVLLSRIVPHIRRSWIVSNGSDRRTIASGEWIVFRSDRVSPSYLRHVLVGDLFHSEFMRTVTGVGGSLLRARPAYVAKIKIPLPSMAEQHRIADMLDRAEALRAKRRAVFATLDTLIESAYVDLFGDFRNCTKVPLESLADQNRHALSSGPFGSSLTSKHYVENGVLVLRGLNVTGGTINLQDRKFVSDKKARELSRSIVTPGDIVVVAVGSSGLACLIPEGFPRAVMSQNFNKITPNTNVVDSTYLCFTLNTRFVQRQFVQNITDTVRTFLSLTKLRGVTIPLPDVYLQRKFARHVAAVDKLKRTHRASLFEMDALFAALQYRGFRGEL